MGSEMCIRDRPLPSAARPQSHHTVSMCEIADVFRNVFDPHLIQRLHRVCNESGMRASEFYRHWSSLVEEPEMVTSAKIAKYEQTVRDAKSASASADLPQPMSSPTLDAAAAQAAASSLAQPSCDCAFNPGSEVPGSFCRNPFDAAPSIASGAAFKGSIPEVPTAAATVEPPVPAYPAAGEAPFAASFHSTDDDRGAASSDSRRRARRRGSAQGRTPTNDYASHGVPDSPFARQQVSEHRATSQCSISATRAKADNDVVAAGSSGPSCTAEEAAAAPAWKAADHLKGRGNGEYEAKNYAAALAFYQRALGALGAHPLWHKSGAGGTAVCSRAASYHANCAAALTQLGRMDEALHASRAALHEDPALPKALLRAAHVHMSLGEYARAAELYERAVEAGAAADGQNGLRMCAESEKEISRVGNELAALRRAGAQCSSRQAYHELSARLDASCRRCTHNATLVRKCSRKRDRLAALPCLGLPRLARTLHSVPRHRSLLWARGHFPLAASPPWRSP